MTLRNMKIFVEVYKCKNMTSAATKLFMTQPSVSQTIKELEDYFNTPLFERLSNRLYPTKAGNDLYYYACHILSVCNEAQNTIRNDAQNEHLKIGGNYTMGIQMLHQFLKIFESENTNIKTSVFINSSSYLCDMIRNSSLDIALVESPVRHHYKDMIIEPFFKDRAVIVAPLTHRLANKKNTPLKEISKEKILIREHGVGTREMFEKELSEANIPYRIYWESISVTSIINVLKQSDDCIAFLPFESVKELLANGELTELDFPEMNIERELVIMYHKNKYLTPSMQNFIHICRRFSNMQDLESLRAKQLLFKKSS